MLIVEGEPLVRDVVLVAGPYQEHGPSSTRSIVHFDGLLEVIEGLLLGDIGRDLSEAVLDACSPTGENFKPYRQFGAPYAFVRTPVPHPHDSGPSLDPDGRLYRCVALSRLVHPTSVGFEYSARVRTWPNGSRQIIPNDFRALNRHAFVASGENNWLNPSDLNELRTILQAYEATRPSQRVLSALWYFEAAFRSYYLDVRWPLLTTGIESLIHIDGERLASGKFAGSTKVFVDRLLRIGAMDATLLRSEQHLKDLYRLRSGYVHGQALNAAHPQTAALYRDKEELLRLILRKALLDDQFRAIFETTGAIQAMLPLR